MCDVCNDTKTIPVLDVWQGAAPESLKKEAFLQAPCAACSPDDFWGWVSAMIERKGGIPFKDVKVFDKIDLWENPEGDPMWILSSTEMER